MKRDMELVRSILKIVEDAPGDVALDNIVSACGCTRREAAYHIEMMSDCGLIRATSLRTNVDVPYAVVSGLTWDGCDYLDAIRSDTVWVRAREAIEKTVGDTSLSTVKQVCSSLALAMVKAQLGI